MYESMRKLRKRHESGEGGFTLVELLIVIVILGILAAIVVLAIGGLATKSKTAACQAEKKTIVTAEDAFFASSADAQGNNATYGSMAQLYTAGNAANLLKDDPTGHWAIANPTGTGYTLSGLAGSNCAGITFAGPSGP
jgi:prepilin-type N-terminal cleavage/methylation domain-containing protein